MAELGIMQGRMVPPTEGRFQCFPIDRWRDEFELAAQAGLGAIEWIYDLYGEAANPLATDVGQGEMRALSAAHGVRVRSVCADYFMDRPLVRTTSEIRAELVDRLLWLIERCRVFGIERIVVPFVDASRIETPQDSIDVVESLERVTGTLARANVEIHLETALSPGDFRDLLARVPHPAIRVNYDSGNSSSLGYAPLEEWAAYGERVGSVHIKDRVLGSSTVALGTGDADFTALRAAIRKVGFEGPFVLQAARGVPGDEVAWARTNRAFVDAWLAQGA